MHQLRGGSATNIRDRRAGLIGLDEWCQGDLFLTRQEHRDWEMVMDRGEVIRGRRGRVGGGRGAQRQVVGRLLGLRVEVWQLGRLGWRYQVIREETNTIASEGGASIREVAMLGARSTRDLAASRGMQRAEQLLGVYRQLFDDGSEKAWDRR